MCIGCYQHGRWQSAIIISASAGFVGTPMLMHGTAPHKGKKSLNFPTLPGFSFSQHSRDTCMVDLQSCGGQTTMKSARRTTPSVVHVLRPKITRSEVPGAPQSTAACPRILIWVPGLCRCLHHLETD